MIETLRDATSHRIRESRAGRVIAKLLNPKFTLSVGAQAAVSAFNVTLNIVLLRLLEKYDYGVFAFALVLGMFALAINNALVATPLTVYTPVIKDAEKRQQQEHMLGTANLLFFLALCLLGLGYALLTELANLTVIGTTFYIAMYAARHYSRSLGYARLRPFVTAGGDLIYVASGTIIMGLLLWLRPDSAVGIILIGLGMANLIANVSQHLRLHSITAARLRPDLLSSYSEIWQQSRWALAGALTTLFMSQAHSLIITGTHGPGTFAPLAAGFVLFGPVRMVLITWQNLVKPELAIALSESRHQEVASRIKQSVMLMAAAVLAMGILLYLCWPWIHALLFAKDGYRDEPMGMIVAMWAVITFCAAVSNAPSAALQALKRFHTLAMATVYGAIISAVSVGILLYFVAPAYTLIGIMLAEGFVAVYLILLIFGELREST